MSLRRLLVVAALHLLPETRERVSVRPACRAARPSLCVHMGHPALWGPVIDVVLGGPAARGRWSL